MGWSYRRSIGFGPLRINLSKSGVGYSVGGTGFRTGVRANGRAYSRVTIPGTGLSYQTSGAGQTGCGFVVAVGLSGLGLAYRLFA